MYRLAHDVMHGCVHMYVYRYIRMYMSIYMYVYIYYVYIYICMHSSIYTNMNTCTLIYIGCSRSYDPINPTIVIGGFGVPMFRHIRYGLEPTIQLQYG